MANVVFYSPQDLITQAHGRSIVKGIDSAMFLNGMSVEQPSLVDFPILKRLFFRKHTKQAARFVDKAKEFAANRIALEKENHIDDIFGSLLGDGKGFQGLAAGELAADSIVMMIAGNYVPWLAYYKPAICSNANSHRH
jgi:hypothetical protein